MGMIRRIKFGNGNEIISKGEWDDKRDITVRSNNNVQS